MFCPLQHRVKKTESHLLRLRWPLAPRGRRTLVLAPLLIFKSAQHPQTSKGLANNVDLLEEYRNI